MYQRIKDALTKILLIFSEKASKIEDRVLMWRLTRSQKTAMRLQQRIVDKVDARIDDEEGGRYSWHVR